MVNKRQDNAHNNFFKDVFSTKSYGVKLLQLILTPSQFNLFNWDTLRSEMETFFTGEGAEKRTDLIFSVNLKGGRKGQKAKIIFLLEHKSYKDKNLLFQLLEYQAVVYKKEPVPIIPIVFYHGKTKTFKQSLKFHDALEGFLPSVRKKFEKHILNFEPILLNVHDLDIGKQAKTQGLTPILFVLQRIWNLDDKTVSKLFELGNRLSPEEKRVQMDKAVDYVRRFDRKFTWRRITLIEDKTIAREEDKIMPPLQCTLDEIMEEGIQKGKKEGREEGRLKGEQEGIQKGKQEGKQEEKKKVALKLLQGGADLRLIKESTELSEDQIKEIEKDLSKK